MSTIDFSPSAHLLVNYKCYLVAAVSNVAFNVVNDIAAPRKPAIRVKDAKKSSGPIFSTSAILSHFICNKPEFVPEIFDLLDFDEQVLTPLLVMASPAVDKVREALEFVESRVAVLRAHSLVGFALFPALVSALALVGASSSSSSGASSTEFSGLQSIVAQIQSNGEVVTQANAAAQVATASAGSGSKKSGNDALAGFDWASAGLLSSLKAIFNVAVTDAFGSVSGLERSLLDAVITRCGNAAHGDFQCNNALALTKALKTVAGYSGPKSPRDIADFICRHIPTNPIVETAAPAPNGFINIKVSPQTIVSSLASIVGSGVCPPCVPKLRVLVDFSSPNIAKDMHVGHLRSTIIGDSVCRVLEFCNHDVLRVNHVGDWGTQFGMLITFLQDTYPDIKTNPPSISDLNTLYKASKKRFDEDPIFKERSRLNVVKLQAGDPDCISLWTMLCEISRAEFQVVYDMLGIRLTEVGESFYNPMLPGVITELQQLGIVEDDQGMVIIRLPGYDIPLIVRKSDGGYGYDSTDMAAIQYRIRDMARDWCIYITDAGQANHFYMIFDAARKAGWVTGQRLDHIGFGVVCGEDGKRFRTRSSETVRLMDLLLEAKREMIKSLQARSDEGKTNLDAAALDSAAADIGYGAVKYFDLKQHPATNYIFSYDRMLDTKGDTAVYLLFAYARLASILRKAKEEKGFDLEAVSAQALSTLNPIHPAERALAFELLQFGDVIKSVLAELLLNRLCEYLHEISVKFTEFVTKCHVLNAAGGQSEIHSRLLLCEATRRVMAKCFELLGINPLDRI